MLLDVRSHLGFDLAQGIGGGDLNACAREEQGTETEKAHPEARTGIPEDGVRSTKGRALDGFKGDGSPSVDMGRRRGSYLITAFLVSLPEKRDLS